LAQRPHLAGGRDSVEEIPGQKFAAISDAPIPQYAIGIGEEFGLFDEHPMDFGVACHDGREQRPYSATDVYNGIRPAPIVGIGDLLVLVSAKLRECAIKSIVLFGMRPCIIPKGFAEYMLHRGLASHNAMTQGCRRPNVVLRGVVERVVAKSAGLMAKQLRDRVIGEYAGRYLIKRAKCSKCPKRAREGEDIHSGPVRKIRSGERARLKMVCDVMANESSNDWVEVHVIQ
jgi:hypothetical protein